MRFSVCVTETLLTGAMSYTSAALRLSQNRGWPPAGKTIRKGKEREKHVPCACAKVVDGLYLTYTPCL